MKEKDDEILTQLSCAKTVCEFCKILNVEMYAKNGDEENLSINMFKTYNFKELLNFGFSKNDAYKIVQCFEFLKNPLPKNKNSIKNFYKKVQFASTKNVINFDSDLEELIEASPPHLRVRINYSTFLITIRPKEPTLLTAAALGDLKRVEMLLKDKGNDVDIQNESGWTPLMYAAQKGLDDVCRRLIKANCSIQLENNRGRTALTLAASWGHYKTLEILIEECHRQRKQLSSNLGKTAKSFVDLTDIEGKSALHHAIYANHVTCVRILLDNGADINLVDKKGMSPLLLAQKLNRSDAIQELTKIETINASENNSALISVN